MKKKQITIQPEGRKHRRRHAPLRAVDRGEAGQPASAAPGAGAVATETIQEGSPGQPAVEDTVRGDEVTRAGAVGAAGSGTEATASTATSGTAGEQAILPGDQVGQSSEPGPAGAVERTASEEPRPQAVSGGVEWAAVRSLKPLAKYRLLAKPKAQAERRLLRGMVRDSAARLEPILVRRVDRVILLGHHTYKAAVDAGVGTVLVEYVDPSDEEGTLEYILDRGLTSSCLDKLGKLLLAARFLGVERQRAKARMVAGAKGIPISESPEEAGAVVVRLGKRVALGKNTVNDGIAVLESGEVDLIKKLKSRKISISGAAKELKARKGDAQPDNTVTPADADTKKPKPPGRPRSEVHPASLEATRKMAFQLLGFMLNQLPTALNEVALSLKVFRAVDAGDVNEEVYDEFNQVTGVDRARLLSLIKNVGGYDYSFQLLHQCCWKILVETQKVFGPPTWPDCDIPDLVEFYRKDHAEPETAEGNVQDVDPAASKSENATTAPHEDLDVSDIEDIQL